MYGLELTGELQTAAAGLLIAGTGYLTTMQLVAKKREATQADKIGNPNGYGSIVGMLTEVLRRQDSADSRLRRLEDHLWK